MVDKTSIVQERAFKELSDELLGLGTTYFSLMIINGDNTPLITKSTNPDWACEFLEYGHYKKCHLVERANQQFEKNNNNFSIIWDAVKPKNDAASTVHEIRAMKNYAHGVGFCQQDVFGNKLLANIAGSYSDINFGLNLMRRRSEVFRDIYKFILRSSINTEHH